MPDTQRPDAPSPQPLSRKRERGSVLVLRGGRGLLRNRLDLDPQRHLHAEPVVLAGGHAELVALDRRQRVRAAQLALEHRMRHALETPDLQLDRTGHPRSEEHTSELQSLMRISYAVFCLKKKKHKT